MKLQIITNLFPLPWDQNRASFNRQQFEYLARSAELRVIVVVGWIEKIRNLFQSKSSQKGKPQSRQVVYFYTPFLFRISYPFTLFMSLIFSAGRIRKYNPDCLFLSWAFPDAVAGTMLGRLIKIPTVIKVHGSDINSHAAYQSRSRQIVWSMQYSSAVITVSQALANRLVELGVESSKIHVIYNGIDHQRFFRQDQAGSRELLGLRSDRKIITFVGNLKVAKGCMDLVAAFIQLIGTRSELDLYFIGDGEKYDALGEKIRQAGLQDRIKLLGSKKHSELPAWLNASDVVALPSHNEGVPNVLLEAMACGVPVVATRVGGIPEIVSDQAGILIEPGEMTELANALETALSTTWNRESIAATVSEFTWDKNAHQVLALLEDVVTRSNQL